MNVTLSRRGGYAVRAAICLARAYGSGQPKKLREISAEMEIPRTFVSQILGDLVHSGIAVSSFGRAGGHRLTRPPDQISLAEVIEAAEGQLASQRCALGDGPCRWQAMCPLHETMTMATASLRDILESATLATVADRDAAIEAGSYPIPADAPPQAAAVAVSDSVQVELPVAAVRARLLAGGAWLTRHAEATDEEALHVRAVPAGQNWLGRTVAIRLGEPAEEGDALAIPLLWEAAGPLGLFRRLEGELRLAGIDPERCELALSGFYRPPPSGAGHTVEEAATARLARTAVRTLLRRAARFLEGEQPGLSVADLDADRQPSEPRLR